MLVPRFATEVGSEGRSAGRVRFRDPSGAPASTFWKTRSSIIFLSESGQFQLLLMLLKFLLVTYSLPLFFAAWFRQILFCSCWLIWGSAASSMLTECSMWPTQPADSAPFTKNCKLCNLEKAKLGQNKQTVPGSSVRSAKIFGPFDKIFRNESTQQGGGSLESSKHYAHTESDDPTAPFLSPRGEDVTGLSIFLIIATCSTCSKTQRRDH